MSNSEDDKEYKGILSTILYIGWAILIFHLYVYCNNSFSKLGIPLGLLNNFIVALNDFTHLFNNTWAAKLAALLPLCLYTFGNKAKKDITTTWEQVYFNAALGMIILFGNILLLKVSFLGSDFRDIAYTITTIVGYLLVMKAGSYAQRIVNINFQDDPFNKNNESFEQETALKANEYSVNLPTKYYYKGKTKEGVINVINPFRAAMVLGTPGSGKSFAVINNYIKQHIEKGFTMYIYDYKYPDLSVIAWHYLNKYKDTYVKMHGKTPTFYTINFDDPRKSHRCNPLLPELMTDIADAVEASTTILYNLNKTWIQKQGDFFVESPQDFLAAIIWYLKKYDDKRLLARKKDGNQDDGKRYCTFPHIIELACAKYADLFPILQSEPEIENLLQPFASALENGAFDQLEGQIASARIPLGRISSPTLYWVMSGNDFALDINNPNDPKILCVGNNPDRQKLYSAALGLYNARLIKIVNKKEKLKSSLIIDELPTIYFAGLDNLIATARSNKVSTCVGLQDLSQLKRDYGNEQATAIFNTIGNIFSGQVVGETAKALSSRFGKILQRSQSFNFTDKEVTTNISTKMDSLIPESVISNLSQGIFVGSVADNYGEKIEQKIFHAEIVVSKEMSDELKNLKPIPMIPALAHLTDDEVNALLLENYTLIKAEVKKLIIEEIDRIANDVNLRHLLPPADENL